ncbi:hypothetical protein AB0D37_43965, partial [Streptomyces sp. NPDC048384]
MAVVKDAVDAAGHNGIAVAFPQASGERTEWIFDKTALALLGGRSVMTKNAAWAKAGQVTGASAILDRAIVNKPGGLFTEVFGTPFLIVKAALLGSVTFATTSV